MQGFLQNAQKELRGRLHVHVHRDASGKETNLRLDHVDPLGSQLSDAVEYIHHAFVLRHVQHDVNGDEAARPPCAGAETKDASQ